MLWKGWSVLFFTFINLCSIPLFTIRFRVSWWVPSTEPVFFTSLFCLFEALALMLPPQQMAAKQAVLSTTDLEKIRNILLQTLKDLSFLKKHIQSVIYFFVLCIVQIKVSLCVFTSRPHADSVLSQKYRDWCMPTAALCSEQWCLCTWFSFPFSVTSH